MNTLKFKTNINCQGCIAKVSPSLNQKQGILQWDVDITTPQKILTVETTSLTWEDIVEILNAAGYKAEKL